MKGILIFLPLVCMVTMINAQSGLSFSYATKNAGYFDLFYGQKDNRFHLGYTFQGTGQMETVVKKRKPNYGLTRIEDGEFFWTIDMGYGRVVRKNITIQGELNIGQREFYTNYQDRRFKDGGYSLVTDTKVVAGVGTNLGYIFNHFFEGYLGYNSLKRVVFGIRFGSFTPTE